MSGGIAYVLDEHQLFDTLCNLDMVDLEPIRHERTSRSLRDLIAPALPTGPAAAQAKRILDNWREMSGKFVKVMPIDYRKALGGCANRRGRRPAAGHRGGLPSDEVRLADETGSAPESAPWLIPPVSCSFLASSRRTARSPSGSGDWHEIDLPLVEAVLNQQAARCMDCGIPFCHAAGCPVKNRIPEFNDLVYRGRWREAAETCTRPTTSPRSPAGSAPPRARPPARWPSTTEPVTIKHIEYQIAERAFAEGWVGPLRPEARSRQARGRDRLRARPDWPPPSSSPAPATRWWCSRKTTASAACCATAFPTSSWKSTSSTAAWSRWPPRASKFEPGVDVGSDISGR